MFASSRSARRERFDHRPETANRKTAEDLSKLHEPGGSGASEMEFVMAVPRRRSKAKPPVQHRGWPISPAKLKRAMHARGLSARLLSKKAGVSEATISHAMMWGS